MNINSTIVAKPPVATEKDLRRCKAIESLLVSLWAFYRLRSVIRSVRSQSAFFQQVSPLLKPDASVTALRRAIGAYVHSKRYYLSCSLADAMRHDLDGNPFEPVSDTDRLNAEERLSASGQQTSIVPTSSIAPSPVSEAQSKRDLIRAALLGKSRG